MTLATVTVCFVVAPIPLDGWGQSEVIQERAVSSLPLIAMDLLILEPR